MKVCADSLIVLPASKQVMGICCEMDFSGSESRTSDCTTHALASLPRGSRNLPSMLTRVEERTRRQSAVALPIRQSKASFGTTRQSRKKSPKASSNIVGRRYRHFASFSDRAWHQCCIKWRRRESNLRTVSAQLLNRFAIAKTAKSAALQMRCIWSTSEVTSWRRLTLICTA
jgi:hypothetical protein